MTFEQIKAFIVNQCNNHNVRFIHSTEEYVDSGTGTRTNGYFSDDGDTPTLAVATNSSTLEVLVHEFCHMVQYISGDDVWNELEGRGAMWDWLEGYEVTDAELDESIYAHMMVEFECERAAIHFHQQVDSGVNLIEYVQRANAYITFYLYVRQNRVWYTIGKEPYTLETVWRQMPTVLDFDIATWYAENSSIFDQCVD